MKKLYSIALVITYLTLSVGVLKNTHYCMGRVQSVEYFSTDIDPCIPGMDMVKMKCCSTDLELVKIEDDQHQSNFKVGAKELFQIQTISVPFEIASLINNTEEHEIIIEADPPPPKLVPIYKINCSYTYYG